MKVTTLLVTVADAKWRQTNINPYVAIGISLPYHFDESILIFRGIRSNFFISVSFFDEIPVSTQYSPRRDVASFGVTSGPIMFA